MVPVANVQARGEGLLVDTMVSGGSRHICGNPNTQLDYGDGDVSFLAPFWMLGVLPFF